MTRLIERPDGFVVTMAIEKRASSLEDWYDGGLGWLILWPICAVLARARRSSGRGQFLVVRRGRIESLMSHRVVHREEVQAEMQADRLEAVGSAIESGIFDSGPFDHSHPLLPDPGPSSDDGLSPDPRAP